MSSLQTVLTFIAANVRHHRINRRMTQEQLAEAVGVSLKFLREIETAKAPASLTVLVSIADALGAPIGDLFQPAEMPEIRIGRPPKVPAASVGKAAPQKAPRKVSARARKAFARRAPGK